MLAFGNVGLLLGSGFKWLRFCKSLRVDVAEIRHVFTF